jgi:Arc/MetJ-type ribon-helix-helix transcriptional regulator
MGCMRQFNLNVTPEFERDLRLFMKRRGIRSKSEAVREALREVVTKKKAATTNYHAWLGLALKGPANPKSRFLSEDDLWS